MSIVDENLGPAAPAANPTNDDDEVEFLEEIQEEDDEVMDLEEAMDLARQGAKEARLRALALISHPGDTNLES